LQATVGLRLVGRHVLIRPAHLARLLPALVLALAIPWLMAPLAGGTLSLLYQGPVWGHSYAWATASMTGSTLVLPLALGIFLELHTGYHRLKPQGPYFAWLEAAYLAVWGLLYLALPLSELRWPHIFFALLTLPLAFVPSLAQAARMLAFAAFLHVYAGAQRAAALDASQAQYAIVIFLIAVTVSAAIIGRFLMAQKQAEFQDTLELAPTGLITLDAGGRILTASENVQTWLDARLDDLKGRPLFTFFDNSDSLMHIAQTGFQSAPQARLERTVTRTTASGIKMTFKGVVQGVNQPTRHARYLVALLDVTTEQRAIAQRDELIDNNQSMVLTQGADWAIRRCSQAWLDTMGYSRDETVGRDFHDFLVPEDAVFGKQVREHLFTDPEQYVETSRPYRLVTKKGDIRFVILKSVLQEDVNSDLYIVLTLVDITELESKQAALERALANAQIYLDAGLGAISLNTEQHVVQYCSQAFMDLVGIQTMAQAPPAKQFYLPDSYLEFIHIREVMNTLATGQVYVHPVLLKAHGAAGRILSLRRSARWFPNLSGPGRIQMVMFEDMTPLVEMQEKLEAMVERDELTGLLSRRGMKNRFANEPRSKEFALFVIDLDHFKSVNDSYGHEAGDALLKGIARTLEAAVQDKGWAVRLGGEEFALIVPWTDWDDQLAFAQHVRAALEHTTVSSHERFIQRAASIGFAHLTPEMDLSTGLHQADLAQREAKQTGRNKVVAADEALYKELQARGVFISAEEVQQALQNDEIYFAIQPIWNTVKHAIEGFEALVRWQKPDGTLVLPSQFVNVLQTVIREPYFKDLENALRKDLLSKLADFPDVYVSFNITLEQLAFDGAAMQLHEQWQVLLDHPARQIVIELSEAAMHARMEETVVHAELWTLHELGYQIALDDFGVESSNLKRLQNFPIDILKLDKVLISDITTVSCSVKPFFPLPNWCEICASK
jgi:diguanylate cyclase (GGDEF)-like protein/PAS domain S-box-containing protein